MHPCTRPYICIYYVIKDMQIYNNVADNNVGDVPYAAPFLMPKSLLI